MGHHFDQGTHFIIPTSVPRLNDILFEDLDDDNCYHFDRSLREGSFFNGCLSLKSGCIDTRTLPADVHANGLVEILSASPVDQEPQNLEDHLLNNYGPTFTHNIYEPVFNKLFGLPLKSLDSAALELSLLTRLVVLDKFASRELKHSKVYDGKIAWESFEDGSSDLIKKYPKSGGVGAWVKGIEKRLNIDGVECLLGCSVTSIKLKQGKICTVELDNGRVIECDEAVWTVPPVSFLKSVGVEIVSTKPLFRKVVLLHYSIDSEVNTSLHWISNYDPKYLSYRITLYPNITTATRISPPHHLTVEVLTEDGDIDLLKEEVFRELIKMGIIPSKAKIIDFFHDSVSPGWPIMTSDFRMNSRIAMDQAQSIASNVVFIGRGRGEDSHFLTAVLEDLYNSLQ